MSDSKPKTRPFALFAGLLIVLLCAGAGLYGTRSLLSASDSDGGAAPAQSAVRVDVVAPQERKVEDAVTGVGSLRPLRQVDIVPTTPGRITAMPVASLEQVAAGDLLIQLDDRSERAALSEAEATFDEAQQDFDRIAQLADSNAAAEAQLEASRATFRRAEAALMMARTATEDRAITAPFAGKLGVIEAEPGGFLTAGTAVTRLSDLSQVEVVVALPEQYFDRVAPGQPLTLTTPAYPDASFAGEVTLRGTQIDLGTRSFEIRARIDNPDQRLVGGMFASTRLVLDSYSALTIPDDAIISEGLSTYVYTVSDGTAKRTSIETGQTLEDSTEITQGLEADDRVVIAGWDQLRDGAPVEIGQDLTAEATQ